MLKTIFSLRLDGELLAEAQRLVDAGEFDNLAQMVEDALRDYLKNFDAAVSGDGLDEHVSSGLHGNSNHPQSGRDDSAGQPGAVGGVPQLPPGAVSDAALEAFVLHGMTKAFDPLQLNAYEQLVEAYSALVQHPLQDAEMAALAEISGTAPLEDVLSALHEAEHSKVPLSPAYLGALLRERSSAKQTIESKEGAAPRRMGTAGWVSDGPIRVLADFDNPLAAEVAKLYEKEIGVLTEKVRDQIAMYIVEFPDLQRWDEAFAAMAGMNKHSLRYVLGVLRGNGMKVVDQKGRDNRGLSKSERHREAKRSRNKDYKDYWAARLKAKQDAKPD